MNMQQTPFPAFARLGGKGIFLAVHGTTCCWRPHFEISKTVTEIPFVFDTLFLNCLARNQRCF